MDLQSPELMLRHPDDALGQDLDALVVGPGLGQGERAETLVGAALASDLPCVVDADALNLISENEDLRHACARRTADTLLTPHPAEAARLLALSTADVQADRVKAAKILATNLNAHVVLKGAGSIVVARDGHWFVNTSGNAGMASAGMGDVLAGILGALLAQRYSGESSLVLGVHLHGAAADNLVKHGIGPVGLTASEVTDAARRAVECLASGQRPAGLAPGPSAALRLSPRNRPASAAGAVALAFQSIAISRLTLHEILAREPLEMPGQHAVRQERGILFDAAQEIVQR